jgi:hypothetical protein
MSISDTTLAAALTALGNGKVFIAPSPTVIGAWSALGYIEGDPQENISYTLNMLKAPQQTGGVVHQATAVPSDDLSFVVPIVSGVAGLLAKLSPHGSEDGWGDNPVSVVERAMWFVPQALLDAAGGTIGYDGAAWTPTGIDTNANMANTLLFMRCFLMHGPIPRPYQQGGKGIVQVTITPMYYAAGPVNKKVWIRGNPVAKGLATFRL